MQSPAETGQGSPLTTTLPFEGSRIPVIEGANTFPPHDKDTTIDAGYDPCARIVNRVSG